MKRIEKYRYPVLTALFSLLLLLPFTGCNDDDDDEGPGGSAAELSVESYYPNSGKEGTLVTLIGSGFSADYSKNTVTFAGTPAVVLSVKPEQLVVQAPVGGSTGAIEVNNGKKTVEAGNYTYQELSVHQLSPANGPAGTNIRILGEGFSSVTGPAKVTINGNEATVVSASDTTLTARVPDNAGSGEVTALVEGKESTGPRFTYQAISSIKPLTGGAGTKVTVTGEGFEETAAGNLVAFNGIPAEVTEAGAGTLVVIAPDGVETGSLTVSINGQKTFGPAFTVVPPPAISYVSPLSGPAGSLVTIAGTQFSTVLDENHVLINGKEIPVETATVSQLQLTLPEGTGSGKVALVVNDQVTEGPLFTVQDLGIVSVSPEGAWYGEKITIKGTGFSPSLSDNVVTFNGTPGTVTAATETELQVTTPADFTTGQLKVNVNTLEAEAPKTFNRQGMVTIAGGPTSSLFSTTLYRIVIDSQQNVFVADYYTIYKITPSGEVSAFATGFTRIYGMAIDRQDNIYIADNLYLLKKTTPEGITTTLSTGLSNGYCLGIDPDEDLYLSQWDYGMSKYELSDGTLSKVITGSTGISRPVINGQGTIFYGDFYYGIVYYCPVGKTAGQVLIGSYSSGYVDGSFSSARLGYYMSGLLPDSNGNLIILDKGNNAIRKADFSTSTVSTLAKIQSGNGFVDGGFSVAKWNSSIPDMAMDQNGNIYVVDQRNKAVRKIVLK